jgi:hypothetical protein
VTGALQSVPSKERAVTVVVPVVGDLLLEEDETFTVELSNPVEAVLIDDSGLGTILDDEVCAGPNLVKNPSNEERPEDGQLPGWTPLLDTTWQRRLAPPDPVHGEATFFAGAQDFAELWQDVDMSAFADVIDGGEQDFRFTGFVRTFDEAPSDVAQIVLEYRDGTGLVLDTYDSGQVQSPALWQPLEDERTAPVGTRALRVRLLATRFTSGDNDAYFDALELRPLRTATLVVDDVELYEGDSGTSDAVFTVTLSCPVEGEVLVSFATADGTALIADNDYLATSGQLVFPEGTTELQVPVPVVGDEVHELHEVFTLDLFDVVSDRPVILADPQGVGTILNDDFCPRSPGFWKNHTELWPTDYLELGGVEYDAAQLLALLQYNGPDASNHLARQLVATKLNLLVGSDPFILPVVDEADLFLVEFPPGCNPKGQDKQRANAIKDELDAYNNLDCAETPVIPGS